ncbi:TonB system transport protein TonB [Proteus mirabilis]|uniref:TonB system transport protein TonB n=1 Tax=Proteus mirabilis TaxID=584 RepID=UPI00162416CD|nr:TonB system transport protein TonB [Proteus mirabilis]MBB6682788.1 TonB system transport protein TonB [Proteus mirabilis]HEK2729006.1 TonB system transport protein TonB [Proteus mirabilis]HEK4023529.1 TonB system transport protein TonB [Proteus mirabilis]
MRFKLWVFISLCLHASLVAAAILYVVEDKPIAPEPISIQMLAFAADEPVGEPEPVVEEVTPPEPEPVVEPEPEPEPEPIPYVKPVIEKPIEKKPEPKPKPKPKPVEKPKPPVERPQQQPLALNKGNEMKNLNPNATPSNKGEEKPVATTSQGEGKIPNVLRQGLPIYPPRAKAVGIEGSIKVRFDIDADGRVDNVEILSANPKNVFEREVRKAMRQWRYEKIPYKGKVVIIDFNIDGVSAS